MRRRGRALAILACAILAALLPTAVLPAAAQPQAAPSERAAPAPPVAPQWSATGPALVLTTELAARWSAEWAPVPGARDYLVEVAGAPSLSALRHPALPTTAPHFDGALPPGRSYLRVRARAEDGSIGPPSESKAVHVLGVSAEPSALTVEGGTWLTDRCSELRFAGAEGVEVARGDEAFAPLPERIPVARIGAGWRLRTTGGEPLALPVRITTPRGVVRAARRLEGVRVVAVVDNLEEAEQRCLTLWARARGARSRALIPLVDEATGAHSAILHWPLIGEGHTTIEVLDASGAVVGTTTIEDEVFEPEPPRRVLGTVLPPLAMSPRTDVPWSAPTAPFAVALAGGVGFGQSSERGVGRVLVQGAWEWLSFDATWRTREAEQVRQEELTWLGVRWRPYEAEQQAFALGIITRTGLPLTEGGRLWLENGLAFGGADDTWSWLVNAGARTRVGGHHDMSNDLWNVHLAGGGSLRPTEWLRIFAAQTTQMLAFGDHTDVGYDDPNPPPDASAAAFLSEWTTGAEIGAGPVLFGPHVIAATAPKDGFEPSVALQLWAGYAPRLE